MRILVVAEVRWGYMHHRKKAIFSRLPKNVEIIYLEPFRLGKKWSWYNDENVKVRSMVCFKRGLERIFSFRLFRHCFFKVHSVILRLCYLGFKSADMVVVANYGAFALDDLRRCSKRIVLDINDIPYAFGMPGWFKANFEEFVKNADKVIIAAEEWRSIRKDAVFISNGVDFNAFSVHRRG